MFRCRSKVCRNQITSGCHEDNRKCPLQEILRLIPQKMSDVFCARHPVIRQLHDKGNRFSLNNGSAHQQVPSEFRSAIPPKYSAIITSAPCFGKNAAVKNRINRKLCRTAHKRRQQNRHLPVTVRGQRPACHNARHGTAKSNQHRHNASAGKTDFAQQLVHHKCNPRHISAVLQHATGRKTASQ